MAKLKLRELKPAEKALLAEYRSVFELPELVGLALNISRAEHIIYGKFYELFRESSLFHSFIAFLKATPRAEAVIQEYRRGSMRAHVPRYSGFTKKESIYSLL